MNHFGELLHLAGVAAANAESYAHRAIACRDVDALGLAWTGDLPNVKAQLAGAIVAAVHALAAAPTPEYRQPIAKALHELVIVGRMPMPRPNSSRQREPHRWWTETDA
jgi:hypothetical protein